MLDERSLRLIQYLLDHDNYVSMELLSDYLNVSKRSVYYALDSVNSWLSKEGFDVVSNVRGLGFRLTENEREAIQQCLSCIRKEIIYTVDERLDLLTFVLLSNQPSINIEVLCDLTDVSRNTLFSDLKRVRSRLNSYGLDLEYKPNEGYEVVGDQIKLRSAFLYYHWSVRELVSDQRITDYNSLFCLDYGEILKIHKRLKVIEKELNTEYVSGTLSGLAALIYVVLNVKQPTLVFEYDASFIYETLEYKSLQSLFSELDKQEHLYFSLHLLGARTQIPSERVYMPILTNLAVDLVDEFERIAAIKFKQRSALINLISNHLSVSYFRYVYGIHHGNPLAKQIKTEYNDVYDLTNQVCDIIRRELEVPVSESEVAFITLHFSSYLRRKNYHDDVIQVDIVCPSGVSTSNMIRTEVENLHPQIQVNKVMSLEEYHRIGSNSNYIITSIALDAPNAIKVNPIINNTDREYILRVLRPQTVTQRVSSLENIMSVITPFVDQENIQPLREALNLYFNRDRLKERGAQQPSLLSLFRTEHCQIINKKLTWQEAIIESGQSLIKEQIIEPRYLDAIIEAVHTFGSYMVLDNGYMLAHASFDDGVYSLNCSFTKLEQEVVIDDKRVNKIFILALVDQVQHFMILKDLMKILGDETFYQHIDACHDEENLYHLIVDFLSRSESES